MRELLTQKEQRQLDILEYLFENPNWIHLDELSKIIVSMPVLLRMT